MNDHLVRGRLAIWHVRPAREGARVEVERAKPIARNIDVYGFSVVRSTRQSDGVAAKAVSVGGTAFKQRYRLQRLDRRARINDKLDIAIASDHVAAGVDDGGNHTMLALDHVTAPDLDGERGPLARVG